jgi:hypothetical protein
MLHHDQPERVARVIESFLANGSLASSATPRA